MPAPAVRERPILFSAPMVRALLDGGKTQTRRVVKLPKGCAPRSLDVEEDGTPIAVWLDCGCSTDIRCPYGQPGDRLWVRETFCIEDGGIIAFDHTGLGRAGQRRSIQHYRATAHDALKPALKWRPSIFMPRWASRIILEVTGVRVERLQDISEEDAKAEGVDRTWALGGEVLPAVDNESSHPGYTYRQGYRLLWDQINGKGNWDANPWVWVVQLRRID